MFTSKEPSVAPSGAREWWDGQKKYVWPGSRETLFAILDAYADSLTAPLREQIAKLEHELVCSQDQYRDCHRDWQLERTRREAAERELKGLRELCMRVITLARLCEDYAYPKPQPVFRAAWDELRAALRGKEGE